MFGCKGPRGASPGLRGPRPVTSACRGSASMWPWSALPVATRKKLTAFLDEGSEIEGKYTFSGTVLLNGKFQGEIASPDTLIIGERGVVNATFAPARS